MPKSKALVPVTGDVIVPGEDRLPAIAADIKSEFGKGIDAQFAIGRLLAEANALFPSKGGPTEGNWGGSTSPFGEWFRAQEFGFNLTTAWRLREAAARESEVREFISNRSAVNGSREVGVTTAITLMNEKPKPALSIPTEETTSVDPAFATLRAAVRVIVGTDEEPANAFQTMHVDDLAACAGYIMSLAEAYKAAKAARHA